MVTLFNGADIKVKVATFCAAMDTLIDQDDTDYAVLIPNNQDTLLKWLSDLASTGKNGRLSRRTFKARKILH